MEPSLNGESDGRLNGQDGSLCGLSSLFTGEMDSQSTTQAPSIHRQETVKLLLLFLLGILLPLKKTVSFRSAELSFQASWVVLVVKNPPATAGDRRPGFDPWVWKIPWRTRVWQPTPVFLPGESPWTEEPGRLQSMGSQRVGHD